MDKFAELLGKFAGAVGVQVERLWPQVVYVYWLRSAIDLLVTPLLIVALLAACKILARKAMTAGCANDDREFFFGVAAIISGVVGTAICFVYFIFLSTLISAVIAPEAAFVLERLPK